MRLKHIRSVLLLAAMLWLPCAVWAAAPEASATSPAAATAQLTTCTECGFEPEALALEKLLAQYTAIAQSGGWPEWKPGKKITVHKSDKRIPTLRRILTVTGDYTATAADTDADSPIYDDVLEEAVKRFQARHGLNSDGTMGKGTQAALAEPVEIRILQIKSTIARIRAHELPIERKFILVNLPAFTLYAVDRDKESLTMRVIVGSRKNHTPLLDNAVTNVIFNPQWHVPERIAKKEMIPKLLADPSYFVKSGFVVTQDGQPVDTSQLVPGHLPPGSGDFTFRQLSGDENALGKIKFNLPDSQDIYLHSTSTPHLFAKDDRALSHGCIRVENPRELAYFVFEGATDWDKERIDKAYDGSRERWVKVEDVPVHLVYWDAFVDANGIAHFYPDIYDKDEEDATSAEDVTTDAVRLASQ